MNIAKKTLSILLTCALLVNPLAYSNDKLAVETQFDKAEFMERVFAREVFLSHDAVNEYIKGQINEDKAECGDWMEERTQKLSEIDCSEMRERVSYLSGKLKHIRAVKITNLFANTGQFAHAGLSGRDYDKVPVMYVDAEYFARDDYAIIKHELDEILGWERLRRCLKKKRHEMRDWIKKYIDEPDPSLSSTSRYAGKTSRGIAKDIHDASYSLEGIYALVDIEDESLYDFGYIKTLYEKYKYNEKEDINIAAKDEVRLSPRKEKVKRLAELLSGEFQDTIMDYINGKLSLSKDRERIDAFSCKMATQLSNVLDIKERTVLEVITPIFREMASPYTRFVETEYQLNKLNDYLIPAGIIIKTFESIRPVHGYIVCVGLLDPEQEFRYSLDENSVRALFVYRWLRMAPNPWFIGFLNRNWLLVNSYALNRDKQKMTERYFVLAGKKDTSIWEEIEFGMLYLIINQQQYFRSIVMFGALSHLCQADFNERLRANVGERTAIRDAWGIDKTEEIFTKLFLRQGSMAKQLLDGTDDAREKSIISRELFRLWADMSAMYASEDPNLLILHVINHYIQNGFKTGAYKYMINLLIGEVAGGDRELDDDITEISLAQFLGKFNDIEKDALRDILKRIFEKEFESDMDKELKMEFARQDEVRATVFEDLDRDILESWKALDPGVPEALDHVLDIAADIKRKSRTVHFEYDECEEDKVRLFKAADELNDILVKYGYFLEVAATNSDMGIIRVDICCRRVTKKMSFRINDREKVVLRVKISGHYDSYDTEMTSKVAYTETRSKYTILYMHKIKVREYFEFLRSDMPWINLGKVDDRIRDNVRKACDMARKILKDCYAGLDDESIVQRMADVTELHEIKHNIDAESDFLKGANEDAKREASAILYSILKGPGPKEILVNLVLNYMQYRYARKKMRPHHKACAAILNTFFPEVAQEAGRDGRIDVQEWLIGHLEAIKESTDEALRGKAKTAYQELLGRPIHDFPEPELIEEVNYPEGRALRGTPEKFLESIVKRDDLFQLARSIDGFRMTEIINARKSDDGVTPKTAYTELALLVDFGVLEKVPDYDKNKKPNYRFTAAFRKRDALYTRRLVDAVSRIEFTNDDGKTYKPFHVFDMPRRGPPYDPSRVDLRSATKTIPEEFLGKIATTGDRTAEREMGNYTDVYEYSKKVIESVRKGLHPEDGLTVEDIERITGELDELEEELATPGTQMKKLPGNYRGARVLNEWIKKYGYWHNNIPPILAHTLVNHRIMAIVGYWDNHRDFFEDVKRPDIDEAAAAFPEAVRTLDAARMKAMPDIEKPGRGIGRKLVRHEHFMLRGLLLGSLTGNLADRGRDMHKMDASLIDVDHVYAAYKFLASGLNRLDIFTDNAGQELLQDLWLVWHLLTKEYVEGDGSKIVLHVKAYPYFVSDVTYPDVWYMIGKLRDNEEVRQIGDDLMDFIASGRMEIKVDPWLTKGGIRVDIPQDVRDDLQDSDLIIVKGECLYRSFVGDYYHSYDADVNDLVKALELPRLLFLRVIKTELAPGVGSDTVRELEAEDPKWYQKGYSMVQLTDDHRRWDKYFIRQLIQNTMDIENSSYLLDGLGEDEKKDDRFYVIRYNEEQLRGYAYERMGLTPEDPAYRTSSPEALLEAYTNVLRRKSGRDNIKVNSMRGDYLISVLCYKDRECSELVGEGHIGIDGELRGQLRVIAMLNMALTASNIRIGRPYTLMNEYEKKLTRYLEEQYTELTGRTMFYQDVRECMKEFPPAKPICGQIDEYYRRCIEQLALSA